MSKSTKMPGTVYDDEPGLERLIFFSDAVFAIAMTLLALDIRLPEGAVSGLDDAGLLHAMLALWPKYLGYVISFMGIGNYWVIHHHQFRYIRRYDLRLVFINLFILLIVAFIPFPTAIISENGNRTATIFYASAMAAVGWLLFWQWRHATQNGLTGDDLPPHIIHRRNLRIVCAPLVFMLSIALAFIHPDMAKFSWLLIFLSLVI